MKARDLRANWTLVLLAFLLLLPAPKAAAATFTQAEARLDGGPATAMQISSEQNLLTNYWTADLTLDLDSSQWKLGPHWLEVRSQTENGLWSPWLGSWIVVNAPVPMVAAE